MVSDYYDVESLDRLDKIANALERIASALEAQAPQPLCGATSGGMTCEAARGHEGLHYERVGNDPITWPEGGRA